MASAVNDLTREVGGVLGIAVLSSGVISGYRSEIAGALAEVPARYAGAVTDGAGSALRVAETRVRPVPWTSPTSGVAV